MLGLFFLLSFKFNCWSFEGQSKANVVRPHCVIKSSYEVSGEVIKVVRKPVPEFPKMP